MGRSPNVLRVCVCVHVLGSEDRFFLVGYKEIHSGFCILRLFCKGFLKSSCRIGSVPQRSCSWGRLWVPSGTYNLCTV